MLLNPLVHRLCCFPRNSHKILASLKCNAIFGSSDTRISILSFCFKFVYFLVLYRGRCQRPLSSVVKVNSVPIDYYDIKFVENLVRSVDGIFTF
jgi:hypothetical protein